MLTTFLFFFLGKAAVRKFCLFVAISVWNLELRLFAELSSLRGLSSDQVSNMSASFVLTKWEKKALQYFVWLNLMIA